MVVARDHSQEAYGGLFVSESVWIGSTIIGPATFSGAVTRICLFDLNHKRFNLVLWCESVLEEASIPAIC